MGKTKNLRVLKLALIFLIFFVLTNYIGVACSHGGGDSSYSPAEVNSCNATSKSTGASPSRESAYCGTSLQTFPVTVSGSAQFNTMSQSSAGFGSETLGGPIAHAEVQIVNSVNGTLVQCTETDALGNFNFTAPQNQNLTIKINSRSSNSYLKASVLDNPTNDQFYSLTKTISTTTTPTLNAGTLTASALGSTLGGAFNILFNLHRANDSLRFFSSSFTVAPKVIAYWTKGVNPNVYVGGSATDGLSFYMIGTDRLYILGGIAGDVNNSDFDHFDDAVISHEYGHFIEDKFSSVDSPGGRHDGNHVIDARLAWGEGWANFFSSAVRANKFYRDCYGMPMDPVYNPSGNGTGCYWSYDLDRNSPSYDLPTIAGEGNFRELAITRALWDSVDPIRNVAGGPTAGVNGGGIGDDNSTDNITQAFSGFWGTLSGPFVTTSQRFRNIGLFLKLYNNVDSTSANALYTSSVLSLQGIRPDTKDFAQPLPTATGVGCSGTSISILANDLDSLYSGGTQICKRGDLNYFCSNQFASNDFYDVNNDGSISTIELRRTSGTAELNLYLYRDPYTFGNQCDMAQASALGGGASKSITLAGLPLGHYVLNVNVYTGNGNPSAASTYQLYVNGNQVCP